jgi:hypothetical protein
MGRERQHEQSIRLDLGPFLETYSIPPFLSITFRVRLWKSQSEQWHVRLQWRHAHASAHAHIESHELPRIGCISLQWRKENEIESPYR